MSDRLVAFAALVQRTTRHVLGFEPPENLSARAGEYMVRLDRPEQSMRFKIALHDLLGEPDLLGEEAANDEAALNLQLRLLDIGHTNERVAAMWRQALNEAPIPKLFNAIFSDALKRSVSGVRIAFSNADDRTVRISYKRNDGWEQVSSFPPDIAEAIMGCAIRAERAGIRIMKPYMSALRERRKSVEFEWLSSDLLEIRLATK